MASLPESLMPTLADWSTGRLAGLAALLMLLTITLGMAGCDDKASDDVAVVKIAYKKFTLELALDDARRFRGLSERTFIEPDGGMLFVFPDHLVAVQGFVMRDCPIAIDIIYLDGSGRIVAMHEMKPEPPRDPAKGEGTPADANNPIYNARLKQYSSRFPSQFVIELAGGTIKTLGVKDGDLVQLDIKALKKRAR
ncbi:MAG: DUF192 domain-containing protein [bacterium]